MPLTAKELRARIESNLYGSYGSDISDSWNYELYRATCQTIREWIGERWNRTKRLQSSPKKVCLLSFEYMPGKLLRQYAASCGIYDVLVEALHSMGRRFSFLEDIERELSLGNGSVGTISMDELSTAASLCLNIIGYGMRYKNGRLKQTLVDGSQVEEADNWVSNKNPWENEKPFFHVVDLGDESVKAIPYDIPVPGYHSEYVNTLRLWRSEALEDMDFSVFARGDFEKAYRRINRAHAIVEFLYPDESHPLGRNLRLKQEVFFASACAKDILRGFHKSKRDRRIREFPDCIVLQINDAPASLSIVAFLYEFIEQYHLSFNEALFLLEKTVNYTNFSVSSESFESWSKKELESVCPQWIPILEALQKRYCPVSSDPSYRIHQTIYDGDRFYNVNLVMHVCRRFISLTKAHDEALAERIEPRLNALTAAKRLPIRMGVSPHRWMQRPNKELFRFLTGLLGTDILGGNDASVFRELLAYKDDEEVLHKLGEIKAAHKKQLAERVFGQTGFLINPESMFDMQLAGFHEAKRQLMNALALSAKYFYLIDHPNAVVPEVTAFFSGKAAPNYFAAKETIHFVNALATAINRDRRIKDKLKLVFIEDYNMTKLSELIPACDIYENLGFADAEPCGTTSIKAMINGAVICTSKAGLGIEILETLGDEACYSFGSAARKSQRDRSRGRVDRAMKAYPEIYDVTQRLLASRFEFIPYDFRRLYELLVRYDDGFCVLEDLGDYLRVKRTMEEAYFDELSWNRKSLLNIAHAGEFSMKSTLMNYASKIWNVAPIDEPGKILLDAVKNDRRPQS